MGIFTQSEQDFIDNRIADRIRNYFSQGFFPGLDAAQTPVRGIETLRVLASGNASLVNGVATVLTPFAGAGPILLTPQDVNSLGDPRVDNLVEGVSFDINSTGATDDGVVGWIIFGVVS